MNKRKAKLKYLPNRFEVIEEGDHVICAVSGKSILLKNLNYWNVELQEAYYSQWLYYFYLSQDYLICLF